MESVRVRPAADEDLDAIVSVFLACWRGSYAEVLPSRLVAVMTDEHAVGLWTRAMRESRAGDLLVAVDPGSAVVGIARVGLLDQSTGHLASLYVAPTAQGTGVGRRLMDAAMERLAAAGARRATLWVFRDNAPSVAFYEHLGWRPDGTVRTQPEFGEPELRLVRSLTPVERPAP